MRWLPIVACILLAFSAEAVTSNGAQFSGATTTLPDYLTQPSYICALGDTQVGSFCDQWGDADASPDAEGIACSEAMARDALFAIEQMGADYPCDQYIWLGDNTDDSYDWEREILRDDVWSQLSQSVRDNTIIVQGNHDATSSCGKLEQYYDDLLFLSDTTGQEYLPLYEHSRVTHGTVSAFSDIIIGAGPSYSSTCFERATAFCFGDPSPGIGSGDSGVGDLFGDACTANGDCKSGQCSVWEGFYRDVRGSISDGIHLSKYNDDPFVVMYGHRVMCRSGVTSLCDNSDPFTSIQNILECDDHPGEFCPVSGSSCTSGTCTTDAPGFETRDYLRDAIQTINSDQTIVWFSGHMGSGSLYDTPSTVLGVNYLTVEIVGPYGRRILPNVFLSAVVKLDPDSVNKAEVVERYQYTNTAPVLTTAPVTTWNPVDGDDDFTLEGTDIDYGDLNYYWGPGSEARDACIAVTQNIATGNDITAVIDLTGCSSGITYPATGGFSICVTDGEITDADDTPTYGLSDCNDPFTIAVP